MPKAKAGTNSYMVAGYGEQADRIRLLLVTRASGEKSQSAWLINRIQEAFFELYGDAKPEDVLREQANPPDAWERTSPMITPELLAAAVPDASDADVALYAPALDAACTRFNISDVNEQADFIAQTAHESEAFTHVAENLNYGAAGLLANFSRHFDKNSAADYARQPERIANRVYANRYGNGDEDSGDGWRYRARGLIGITFKANYNACGTALGLDLINHPELLEQPTNAALSAGWFWTSKNLNALAEAGDFVAESEKINGGDNGLADREDRRTTVLAAFQA
ncbi:glycoside hydrolase family 19 protein [Telmatospirillum sp.]|uniref:glycoside hydrolase family 19 protein n=1 Tax=Telmatospirillum sp. TaxID=2079197 RepID=UPI0028454715|nr:glycoside hydrolase family 19 protein [Telmatospirillum sp.]MDR3436456.1 glycoside hydrolase family 19 protein [Telmatospirillum sp.]